MRRGSRFVKQRIKPVEFYVYFAAFCLYIAGFVYSVIGVIGFIASKEVIK